jgi:hypothetical protein
MWGLGPTGLDVVPNIIIQVEEFCIWSVKLSSRLESHNKWKPISIIGMWYKYCHKFFVKEEFQWLIIVVAPPAVSS